METFAPALVLTHSFNAEACQDQSISSIAVRMQDHTECANKRLAKLCTERDEAFGRLRLPQVGPEDEVLMAIDVKETLGQMWPRQETMAAMCVQNTDARCVLQFALVLAVGCVLHRLASRVIHRQE